MKRRTHIFLVTVASLLALPLTAVPAHADLTRSFDRSFTRTMLRKIPALDRCVRIRVSGRIKGTRTYSGRGGYSTDWSKVRVVRPTVRATVLDYHDWQRRTRPYCAGRARVKKIAIKQEWKYKRCEVEITSVSVGFPWAIGAGFGCSADDRVARRRSVDGRGTYATQYNSDTVIRYDHKWYVSRRDFVANVRLSVRIHRRMGSGHRSDQVSGVARVALPGS